MKLEVRPAVHCAGTEWCAAAADICSRVYRSQPDVWRLSSSWS